MDVARLSVLADRSFQTERDVYQSFLDLVVECTGSEIGYLHLYDETREEIQLNVWSEAVISACTTIHDSHYPLRSAGVWGDCVRNRAPAVHNDEASLDDGRGLPEGHVPLYRHMSLPVFDRDRIVAIVGVGNALTSYDPETVAAAEDLIREGWPIVQRKLSEIEAGRSSSLIRFEAESIYAVLTDMLGALSRALEMQHESIARHQENVAFVAGQIAEARGLAPAVRQGLEIGALVHDVGKIGVPPGILGKPGTLTADEFEIIKQHTVIGSRIFEAVNLPWPVADMIRQHHERMDGSGYPDGLVGNMICLEARILAVADSYDAMCSDRPYRRALGNSYAVKEIVAGRDRTYDPYVVDAFLACVEADPTFGGRYPAP